MGWAGQKDHVLFPTIDKGFEFEHDLKKLSFGIIVLTTANNRMPSCETLLEELVRQIEQVSPGGGSCD